GEGLRQPDRLPRRSRRGDRWRRGHPPDDALAGIRGAAEAPRGSSGPAPGGRRAADAAEGRVCPLRGDRPALRAGDCRRERMTMRFHPTDLADAVLIEIEKRGDERGFFARTFCEEEFAQAGLVTCFVQANASASRKAGTLRGLHYQVAPHAETKV